MLNQENLNFSKNKNNNNPTYTVNKDGSLPQTEKASTAGMMGGAGLGALVGMGIELAKLRRKILEKWHRDTIIAQREGMPLPPKPDTSKGALMAILKGAAIGGAAGGIAGKIVPGVNDVAASMDGFVRKTLTGSKLTTSEDAKFSEMLPYLDKEIISSIDFSNINPYELFGVTSDDFKYALFSRIEDYRQENFARYKGDTKGTNKNVKQAEEKLVQNNPKAEMDRQILGKSNVALPVLGALVGGSASALKAYNRAKSEWEWQYKEALERGDPPPPEPSIFDFIGEGAKGAMVGGVGGTILSKIGPGKAINDKLSEATDKWGITTNRKKANKLIHDDLKSKGKTKSQEAIKNAANIYGTVKKGVNKANDIGKKVSNKAQKISEKIVELNAPTSYSKYKESMKKDFKEAPSFQVWLAKKVNSKTYKGKKINTIDPSKPEWANENKEYWDYVKANYKMFSYVDLINSIQVDYFSNNKEEKQQQKSNLLNQFKPNNYSELISGIKAMYFSEELSGEDDSIFDNELAKNPDVSNKIQEGISKVQEGVSKLTDEYASTNTTPKEVSEAIEEVKDTSSKFLKKGNDFLGNLTEDQKTKLKIGAAGLAGFGLGTVVSKNKNKNFSYTSLIDSVYQQYFNDEVVDDTTEDDATEKNDEYWDNLLKSYKSEDFKNTKFIIDGKEVTPEEYVEHSKNNKTQYNETQFIPIKYNETKYIKIGEKSNNDEQNSFGKIAGIGGAIGATGIGGALIAHKLNKKKEKNFSYTDLIDNISDEYFSKKSALKKAGIATGTIAGLGALGLEYDSIKHEKDAINRLKRLGVSDEEIEELKDIDVPKSYKINVMNRLADETEPIKEYADSKGGWENMNIFEKAALLGKGVKTLSKARDMVDVESNIKPITLKDKALDLIGRYGENDKVGLDNYDVDYFKTHMGADFSNSLYSTNRKKLLQNFNTEKRGKQQ